MIIITTTTTTTKTKLPEIVHDNKEMMKTPSSIVQYIKFTVYGNKLVLTSILKRTLFRMKLDFLRRSFKSYHIPMW